MENVEIWNNLVKHFNDNRLTKEEKLQKDWEYIFYEFFGYSRFYGEIDSHRSIHIGSHQRIIPDIIIKDKEKDLFDIELKQYNLFLTADMEKQLKSYLCLLHISIGVLICDSIYLYSYDLKRDVLKKVKIEFVLDNPNGIAFVSLLKKGSFSPDKVAQFIDEKTLFEENVKQIRSEITPQLILELLVKHFNTRFTIEEIDKAIASKDYTSMVKIPDKTTIDLPTFCPEVKTAITDEDVYEEPPFDYVIVKTSHDCVSARGSLYEATRYGWRAGKRILNYSYVLSVINMVVQEVYIADYWNIRETGELVGRYEFHGRVCTEDSARKLVGKKIPYEYRKPGSSNPLLYKSK